MDGVGDKAFPLVVRFVRRQEADEWIDRQVQGFGIDRGERPLDRSGQAVEFRRGIDKNASSGTKVDACVEELATGGNVNGQVAETKAAQLECVEVQVGIELLGDEDLG